MKKLFITSLISLFSITGYSQSVDERIADAMNTHNWYELRELYQSSGWELQTPFLHPLSKFFIHHFFHQPDSALHYGGILLEKYQTELGASVSGIVYYMADDYVNMGDYQAATDILHRLNEATRQAGQTPNPTFVAFENQNRIIAEAGGFKVEKPLQEVKIPIRFYKDNLKDPVMLFVPAELNGIKQEVNYDTGAGVNVMSKEMAEKIGARIQQIEGIKIEGVQSVKTQFAMVDSVRLGEIVYRNVPFQIADFLTQNEEANAKIKELNYQCVLGNQTMLPLQEIQFDFANRCLVVPATPTPKPTFAPNMHYTDSRIFVLSVFDKKSNQRIDACLDTGAAVSMLLSRYYNRHKSLFEGVVPNDSARMAGVGGVSVARTFKHRWEYGMGSAAHLTDSVDVIVSITGRNKDNYDALFGLPSLVKHDRVIVNFQDMWMDIL